ncbi:hypothetical protein [Flavobacterium sp. 3HN19-14]|uniref:hypothetical protein n=1 Tax=Flavobacterium sp. 3HN19-14 TaxID=3448133 RepID=UPI003EDFED4A
MIIALRTDKRERISIFIVSMILFTVSLTQYVYTDSSAPPDNKAFGFMALLLGWLDIFGTGISWCANPALWVSWVFLFENKIKAALIVSALSVMFSFSFLLFSQIYLDEGGNKGDIVERNTGYWLWLASCPGLFSWRFKFIFKA